MFKAWILEVSGPCASLPHSDGVNVTSVIFGAAVVTVTVALRRRRLVCPHCGFETRHRYDTRPVESRWRHLDLGVWRLEVRATLRRLACPAHGVVVEAVPFARPGGRRARLTRDFDDLLAWLATRTDKTAIARLCRVAWRTVGRARTRVVATELDPGRLGERRVRRTQVHTVEWAEATDGLFRIGVDEISWRKHHKYLTLVVDHDQACVVWGASGRDAATLDRFFTELGTQRSSLIEAVSLDLGPAYLKSVATKDTPPRPSSAPIPSTSSSSPQMRSTRYAETSGSNCVAFPTTNGPETSKAAAGPC
ncbi:MAG: hypothetical protein DYH08_09735 [Actinobacteria bacterium ATB1]|nr:hypothetical protein [Actinobacteria bacterium ATB1]